MEENSVLGSYIRVIDIVLGAIIFWGAYKGYRKGFIIELVSTLVFIIGMLLVFYLIANAVIGSEGLMEGKTPRIASFGTYMIVYLVMALSLNALSRRLQKWIDYSVLDDFDNFAGMTLGGLKYAIFLAILLGLLQAAGLQLPDGITQDSHIYNGLLEFQKWLAKVGGHLAPFIKTLNENMHDLLGNPNR